jgi:hypothetical protein
MKFEKIKNRFFFFRTKPYQKSENEKITSTKLFFFFPIQIVTFSPFFLSQYFVAAYKSLKNS